MITSLVRYVRKNVSPEDYYKFIFPEIEWSAGNKETKVLSPFVEEKVPSLSINKETGAWYSFCAADERGGNSIISFQVAYEECSHQEAAQYIYHKFIHPVIPESQIRKGIRRLQRTPSIISYLKKRLFSKKVILAHRLGWNGKRIMFPVYNEFGLCINIKLYSPTKPTKSNPKMISYTSPKETRSFGSPTVLYPLEKLIKAAKHDDPVYICEGECDTLALITLKLAAITSTSGAKSWPSSYNDLLQGKDVVIVYDNDLPGKIGTKKVCSRLKSIVRSIRVLEIPKKYGKDVTDYLTNKPKMRKAQAWQSWIDKTKVLLKNPDKLVTISLTEVFQISLDRASEAQWCGKRIQVEALVTGKEHNPYILPQKYRVSCRHTCEDCLIAEGSEDFKEFDLEYSSSMVLRIIDSSYETKRRLLLHKAGIFNRTCKAKIEELETFNVEWIQLIPTLDSDSVEYVTKSAYFIGYGLHANRAYQFEGALVTSAKNQQAVFLFDSAKPIRSEIETFDLSETVARRLIRFSPKRISNLAKLRSIAEWQSSHVTKIVQRWDLHVAIDLAFHSVPSFYFNKDLINRGMLDILILGDTKCGKGFVTERLSKYYKLGSIASGDNCTFAGLIGGLHQLNNNWRVSWGLIPLNHKRLVIIDEASSMSYGDIAKMSRIRSEGVAELVKIVRETTQANTRLIWLANPRSGKRMATYNTGVEAVKELIGAVEDISRFDFVLTVATDEVSSEDINVLAEDVVKEKDKFPKKLCQALVLWAWSRRPEQIVFTKKATNAIIKKAKELGHIYSSAIPIVQGENIRIKLAKISAAVAARLFSTNEYYEKVIIKSSHVDCAVVLLKSFYDKPSMSYNLFSRSTAASSKIGDFKDIDNIIKNYSSDAKITFIGLLELQRITPDALADYIGNDSVTAKSMIGELVQARCLFRHESHNEYIKSSDFVKYLHKKRKELLKRKRND